MSNMNLPPDLIPADGRFGSGPSKVRVEALAALAETGNRYLGTSHRRDGVRSVVRRVRGGLAELFSLPDGYEVLLGNGGASAVWDAAVFRLIERRSAHAVCGEFSGRFAAISASAPHLEDPIVVESPPGTYPDLYPHPDVDLYALTHCETSTGVMMPIIRPASSGLVAVDATSAAGALSVDCAEFDAYYFSPQKVFGAEGGLWAMLCSPAALERIDSLAATRWAPPSIDLAVSLQNSRKDQTLNTPALATLFLFADQVEWLLGRGGIEWAQQRCRISSETVYGWAEASDYAKPYVDDAAKRSLTVATIDLDDLVDAGAVTAALRSNGIVDLEAYRKLERNQVRIAMFPNVEPSDLERLTKAIDWIAARL